MITKFLQFIKESVDNFFYHGTPSGEFVGHYYGIHVGTYEAAKQALEARIGIPVEGSWDGTREYGKTLLVGNAKLYDGNYNNTGYNASAPRDDYYPNGKATYSDGTPIPLTVKPIIFKVRIVGAMSNTPYNPMNDIRANATIKAMIKKGQAKRGYYYINDGEDAGSISAVVPNGNHLEIIP